MEDAHETAREVGRALLGALGEDLVAVYLHGSAVLGGFRWERSDLDLLALSRAALSDQQFGRVVGALAPLNYPANGLEFTLMTAGEASQPELPAPGFQLHVTTGGWRSARNVVDGRLREGDRDLVLHLAVCREHGDAIVGPPARSALAELPGEAIESAMREEIGWARARPAGVSRYLRSGVALLCESPDRIEDRRGRMGRGTRCRTGRHQGGTRTSARGRSRDTDRRRGAIRRPRRASHPASIGQDSQDAAGVGSGWRAELPRYPGIVLLFAAV